METSWWEPCLTSHTAIICLHSAASAHGVHSRDGCFIDTSVSAVNHANHVITRREDSDLWLQINVTRSDVTASVYIQSVASPIILFCSGGLFYQRHTAQTNQSDQCLCWQIKEQTWLNFILVVVTECVKTRREAFAKKDEIMWVIKRWQKQTGLWATGSITEYTQAVCSELQYA